jgi:hypothetical protein
MTLNPQTGIIADWNNYGVVADGFNSEAEALMYIREQTGAVKQ